MYIISILVLYGYTVSNYNIYLSIYLSVFTYEQEAKLSV